jgi:hypothetical protein
MTKIFCWNTAKALPNKLAANKLLRAVNPAAAELSFITPKRAINGA